MTDIIFLIGGLIVVVLFFVVAGVWGEHKKFTDQEKRIEIMRKVGKWK